MLVDSNILIYSINASSSKHKTAQKFLQDNRGSLQIAHQNIFEAIRVLTHKKFPNHITVKNALEAIGNITETCEVITPDHKTHKIALLLIKKYKLTSDQVFDAYLAATALSNEVQEIATDNVKDFQKIKEINVINPFTKVGN